MNISILIAKLPNLDYDGDELNIFLYLDNYLADLFTPTEPHFSVPSLNAVGEVAGLITLTDPVTSTISNKLARERFKLK